MAKPIKNKATKKELPKKEVVKKGTKEVDTNDLLNLIAGDIKGNIMADQKEQIKFVKSRMSSYNRASILGGFPAGCIYEIKGPNAGGKTALGMEILSAAQQAGHLTIFHDHERAANDKVWLSALGLDLTKCIYRGSTNDGEILTLEDSAEEINDMIIAFNDNRKKGKIPKDVLLYILFDSVAAACPKAKLAKGAKVGDANYGLTARLMSDWLQTLEALVGGSNVAVIFINQERVNVGAKPWESKFKSFGGEALQFYATMRIRVTQAGEIKEKVNGEEIIVGRKHRFTIEKNKLGYPQQKGMFYTSNGLGEIKLGFDDVRSTVEEAINQGVITRPTSASYESEFWDGTIAGEKKVRKFIQENEEIHEKIKDAIYELVIDGKAKLAAGNEEDGEDEE